MQGGADIFATANIITMLWQLGAAFFLGFLITFGLRFFLPKGNEELERWFIGVIRKAAFRIFLLASLLGAVFLSSMCLTVLEVYGFFAFVITVLSLLGTVGLFSWGLMCGAEKRLVFTK